MTGHPALQDTSPHGPATAGAVVLATTILEGEISLDRALDEVAAHFLATPRVGVVTTALTKFAPEDEAAWTNLGGRAWLREWVQEGSSLTIVPPPGAGPEAALSMPWLSQFARAGIVALVDRDLLPDAARQDGEELARFGLRSQLASTFTPGGEMFGSLSMVSAEAGPWPHSLVEDLRLLNAAMSSRLELAQSQRALANAIATGSEARLAFQQFFASVGHELRTPLAAIVGYTEMLMQEATEVPPEPVATALLNDGPIILRACDQLVSVMDSLLGTGRTLSTGDTRQTVLVADALADVVHWHRTPAHTAQIDLTVGVDPDTTVWAHPSGVRQVLTNLVTNAISHHHAQGSVHLSAETFLGESGHEVVRIVVRDDGPGLTGEELGRAFEPFVRFASPETKGSGLGLPLSRTIAERDGGTVRGESTPGVGSTFWVELPASPPRST